MRVSLNYNLMDLKFLNSEMEAAQLDVDYQKECDESRKYIYIYVTVDTKISHL